MDNSLNLIYEKEYLVIKPFTDYDGIVHGVGEIRTYQGTHFFPYDDGLTLHVLIDNKVVVYRLQWLKEEQADTIESFAKYIEPY